MPCINDTPEDQTRELASDNKLLTGALCAALCSLYSQHQNPTWPAQPVTELKHAARLVNLDDSGVDPRWLTNWWQMHLAKDAARRKREELEAKNRQLRSQALAKLTDEERTALGHPPAVPERPVWPSQSGHARR